MLQVLLHNMAMLGFISHPVLLQGDSGFMLVRSGRVVYRSPILQHFFDCPLQFGAAPDYSESTDTAEDAAVAELQVQPGDVLLAGSDGLWDNCFDSEILQMLPDRAEGAEQVIVWAALYWVTGTPQYRFQQCILHHLNATGLCVRRTGQ